MPGDLRQAISRAVDAWLLRTPSPHTHRVGRLDLDQFLAASGIKPSAQHVSQWRERSTAALPGGTTTARDLLAARDSLQAASGHFPARYLIG